MSMLTLSREETTTSVLVPRVNLLPPEIAEAARFRRMQGYLGGAVLASVALVGALTLAASAQVSSAQEGLDAAQTRTTQLQAQVNQFAEVPKVYAAVADAETQLSSAMANEVRWSFYLNDLSLTVPSNVALTSLTVKQNLGGAGAGAVQSPVGNAGIATVDFVGEARANNDVAAFLDALAKQKGYVDPYFSSATQKDAASTGTADAGSGSTAPLVAFNASVTVTETAKSGRYVTKAN